MNSKLYLGAVLTVILIGGSVFAAGKPKITLEEAQAVALKRIPGTVESSGMHKKDYSFEILGTDGIRTNVIVTEKGKIKELVDR